MAGVEIHYGYALMVLMGFALVLAFPLTRGLASSSDKRRYWTLQVITLLGALFGAKFAVLMGDGLWPLKPVEDWRNLMLSGRSIVGALLFGFLAAEAAKPLLRYHLPPNDRFAMVLPFSLGVGRIGCLLAGCCLGLPWDGPWAIAHADGVPRHPAALYELLFDFGMGFLLLAMYRRQLFPGRLFALFLLAYGVFRFGSEFWRDTAKAFAGLSAYQWLSLALIACGAVSFILRTRRPPPAWGAQAAGASA